MRALFVEGIFGAVVAVAVAVIWNLGLVAHDARAQVLLSGGVSLECASNLPQMDVAGRVKKTQ